MGTWTSTLHLLAFLGTLATAQNNLPRTQETWGEHISNYLCTDPANPSCCGGTVPHIYAYDERGNSLNGGHHVEAIAQAAGAYKYVVLPSGYDVNVAMRVGRDRANVTRIVVWNPLTTLDTIEYQQEMVKAMQVGLTLNGTFLGALEFREWGNCELHIRRLDSSYRQMSHCFFV